MEYGFNNITFENLKLVFDWRNQKHIRDVMYNNQEITWEEHINWFNQLQNNSVKMTKIFKINDEPLGVLNISKIDRFSNKCEWGFYIGASNIPKGIGKLFGYAALNYIFTDLGIRKIGAEVIGTNMISRKFHENLGFHLDGILRQNLYRDSKYLDVYIYSIFQDEWDVQKKILKQQLNI